jgi:alpha-L-arabinofuranosidase
MRVSHVLAAAVMAAGTTAGALGVTVSSGDWGVPGTPINPGIRGQAVPDLNMYRPGATVGNGASLEVARGSSIRGVFGGLEADFSDWRTRNDDARPTTLDFLRYSRDYNADLVITTNVRGLAAPDPSIPGNRIFTDTSIPTITRMAADWVRYTNVIAQTHHVGDTITNPDDQRILNSLVWNSADPNDVHDLLPEPGEAPVPKVTYWEIGNEPRVGLSGGYHFSNSFTFLTPNHTINSTHKYDYAERYASMTSAMKAVDPTIKVGPCLQSASATTERELLNSILNRQTNGQYLPVDFISYHPYQKLMDQTDAASITAYLKTVYTGQKAYADNLRNLVAASGRNPNSVELISSETNVSNWPSNDTVQEAQMAHAIGSVETIFSFARLGLSAAHYWIFPANQQDGTRYPVYKAYEGLRDHMGDALLSVDDLGDGKLYTTRDSATGEIAIWGLNFTNDQDLSAAIDLSGLAGYHAKLMTLQSLTGPTTLFSANLAWGMPGGPTADVDWVTQDLAGQDLSSYVMNLPAATISVLLLDDITVPEPASAGLLATAATGLLLRRRRRD